MPIAIYFLEKTRKQILIGLLTSKIESRIVLSFRSASLSPVIDNDETSDNYGWRGMITFRVGSTTGCGSF